MVLMLSDYSDENPYNDPNRRGLILNSRMMTEEQEQARLAREEHNG